MCPGLRDQPLRSRSEPPRARVPASFPPPAYQVPPLICPRERSEQFRPCHVKQGGCCFQASPCLADGLTAAAPLDAEPRPGIRRESCRLRPVPVADRALHDAPPERPPGLSQDVTGNAIAKIRRLAASDGLGRVASHLASSRPSPVQRLAVGRR